MLVAHVLREKGAAVHTMRAEATLEQAAKALDQRKVGAVVVLNENGHVVGVLSERDIIREIAQSGAEAFALALAAVMTRDVITARLEESIDECLARMTDRRVRHLPVIEDGQLVGIISIGDLVKHRIAAIEADAAAMQAYIAAH